MQESINQQLQVIDESLFYQLLGGLGTVHADISRMEEYFVPFISLSVDEDGARLPCGAVVCNQYDLLAADSLDKLIKMLQGMAGNSKALRINYLEEPEYIIGFSRTLH